MNDIILDYESSKSFHHTYDRKSEWKFEEMMSYDGGILENFQENEAVKVSGSCGSVRNQK